MGTLMEPRIINQEYASLESSKVKILLQDLNLAKEQLKKEKAYNEALKEECRLEFEALVAARTQELEAANLNLRMQMAERRKAEQQLYFEAHHDSLTKLPNRAMFSDRLSYAIRHFKRHPDQKFAVLFIDLDRFKNDK